MTTPSAYELKLLQAGIQQPASTYLANPGDHGSNIVTSKTDPLTGGVSFTAGGGAYSLADKKNTVALLGDSITLRNQPAISGGVLSYGQDGYFVMENTLLGWPFEIVGVSGNSGQDSTYILSRVAPDILSINPVPRYCVVLAGTNDYSALTSAQTIANLKAIYTALWAAGVTPIACTLPPRNDTTTQAQKRKITQVNRWIREYARNADIYVRDYYRALTNTTGGWTLVADGLGALNDTSSDQIHPSFYAGYLMGMEGYRRMIGLRPNNQLLGGLPQAADTMYVAGQTSIPEGNILQNGALVGIAGVTGGTATGSLASNWSTQVATVPATGGTIVLAKVAQSDSFGEWQQINMSGGTAGDNQGVYAMRSDQDPTSVASAQGSTTWQIGDSVYGQVAFETDSASWANGGDTNCAMSCRVQFLNATGTVTDLWHGANGTAVSKARWPNGVMRTPSYPIPPGTTRVYFWIYVRGRGVWRFRDAEVRKVISL
jgi:lysophospholipase L1-like esterase